jgi:Flp pilus assembly pilin Flp
MDWRAIMRPLGAFTEDERGGESVEYACTSLVAVAATAITQRAMSEGIADCADKALRTLDGK